MGGYNDIVNNLSLSSRDSGKFIDWLKKIEKDRTLANKLSKELLFKAEKLCPELDNYAFKELINSIRKSVGLGKGVMTSTLSHMPETLSRSMLKQWMIEDSQWKITEADWEGIMLHAFQNKRFHLAQDMMVATKVRYGESSIISVLGCLDETQLKDTESLWSDYRDILVASFCSRQSWSGAMRLAGGSPDLEKIVLNSICTAIKFTEKKKSWASALKFMIDRSDAEIGIDGALDRFKSAGRVALNAVMDTPKESLDDTFDTEELKLMAFQLGLQDVTQKMSKETKREALAFSLGI